MFVELAAAVEVVEEDEDEEDEEEATSKIPRYEKVIERLERFEETNHTECLRLLGWLACSKRPVKLFELQAAVSIDIEEQTMHKGDHAWLSGRLQDLFEPLITVKGDQTLNFIHPTAKAYRLKHKIRERDVHVQLSVLTLAYLSLPGLEQGLLPDEFRGFLTTGYYAFLDYTVVCWPLHLQDAASKQVDKDAATRLVESVDVFLDARWTGTKGPSDANVTQTTLDTLSLFEGQEFFSRLCLAFACAKKQLSVYGQGPSDNEPLDLAEVVSSIRQILEGLSLQEQALQRVAQLRDDHTARHERPYICTEPTCYVAALGCPTKKALQKHLLEDHGIDLAEDVEFPEPPSNTSNTSKASADFACTLCPKTYTRNENLKIHMRKHQREKPYSCSVCGLRFARDYDRKRHEGLHSEEKRYICSGKLEDGRVWRCGKNFTRQDKLTEHYRAKAGRNCLQLLAEEESRKQAGNGKSPDVAELLGVSFLLDPDRFRPF
ncbi:hypothetical protein B0T25DRAFT_598097 [Lasiosphaeria hispida]|uniref:C2H2-type domain-containing protein n=1 Tax=Lasiosphaeria hispida TaxID=260671 RepID=A0AAJ0ML33_9PEZI|nr:hypothetical protein B0T25DRAFT_598097 [Lasiosphaeria hispida]